MLSTIIKDLSKGVVTNINQETIRKFIDFEINKMPKWNFEMLNMEGIYAYEKCYSLDNLKAFVIKPNLELIENIKIKIQKIIN